MNTKINATVEKYNMISAGDTVLVAASGGADSMLLLDYFVNNKDRLGVSLKVAHVEHGIRGEESQNDALFVENYCKGHNVPFYILHIDAPNESRASGLSVEEYSRNRRYEFFSSIECDKIATAHNLTDNVETLIYRLCRGTGLKGACGIPAVRGKIIRPLIEIESSEIRQYCRENNIEYQIDSTNLYNDYSRNLIRNKVLPLLADINSDYQNNIFCFINDTKEDIEFIEDTACDCYLAACSDGALLVEKLKRLSPSIAKRVIKRYFSENNICLDRVHLCEIAKLINKTGRVQIKDKIFAVSNKSHLRLSEFNNSERAFYFSCEILNINEFNAKNIDFHCDYDKINGSVTVRGRKEGDTISPVNRNCTKSLKKLFNEMSIPVEKRDSVNVICDDNGVIGFSFGGYTCVDERVRVDNKTENVITIKFPLEE